jgi:PAB-dependent poly(A)-specific ribonuclease subunit 2
VPIQHLRRATQLVATTSNGSILLLDPRTPDLAVSERVLAHTGGISQVETEGNNIVTIGYTMR